MKAQVINTTTYFTKKTATLLWNNNIERFEVGDSANAWERVTHIIVIDAALTAQEQDEVLGPIFESIAA